MTYQMCSVCVNDTSIPEISFAENGVCNYCDVHNELERQFPLNLKGRIKFKKLIDKIKFSSKSKFDCIVGISGGRDSIYSLWYVKTQLKLNPLAVHFNDGFGNPTAGENMLKSCKILGVELRTITSNYSVSRDIRIAHLKASTPDFGISTDIGIAAALYGVANKEGVKYVLIGNTFRTEGITPLTYSFLDGKYIKSIHKKFGAVPWEKWVPNNPGFNLGLKEMFYYSIFKRIKSIPILYFIDYRRKEVDKLLEEKLQWVKPGAHYADDLLQSLVFHIQKEKFGVDRRRHAWSALIRSGQMEKELAIKYLKEKPLIQDPKLIQLCLKRLGVSQEEFDDFLCLPKKTFKDYKTSYTLIKIGKPFIWIMSRINIIPASTYLKFFKT